MASTTAQQNTQAHLLNLPPELRNKMYEYALSPSEVGHCVVIWRRVFNDHPTTPFILQTCRKVRHEALPIYYASNTFLVPWEFGWYSVLRDWLAALPTAARIAICRINVRDGWCYRLDAMRRRLDELTKDLEHHGISIDPRVLHFRLIRINKMIADWANGSDLQ